jgi:hypothetical protein
MPSSAAIQPAKGVIKRARASKHSADFIDNRIDEVCNKLHIQVTPQMRSKVRESAKEAALKAISLDAIVTIHTEEVQATLKQLTANGGA